MSSNKRNIKVPRMKSSDILKVLDRYGNQDKKSNRNTTAATNTTANTTSATTTSNNNTNINNGGVQATSATSGSVATHASSDSIGLLKTI